VPQLLASLRADGHHITSVQPPGRRARYCLGSYVDPNQLPYGIPLYGYDFCQFGIVADLLNRATDSGQQQVFSGTNLASRYNSLVILVQAVYKGAPTSRDAREHDVLGWVLGVINGTELSNAVPHPAGMQYAVFNRSTSSVGSTGVGSIPVFRSAQSLNSATHWTFASPISAYGRWTAKFRPTSGSTGSVGDSAGPRWLLTVGLIAVGLLLALLISLLTARRRADLSVDRATRLLRASEERFKSLSSSAPIGIIEFTPRRGVIYANPKMEEISGRDVSALMGSGLLECVHTDDAPGLLERIQNASEDRSGFEMIVRVVHTDGGVRHARILAAPRETDPDGAYVVSVEDISDEVASRQELTYRAFHDALTGLPNRALFLDRLNVELARRRRDGSHCAVLFLDLDAFKIVNDSLGHEVGDCVLKEIGSRFQNSLRKGETAARFSGDEFAFILADISSKGDAIKAADRLLHLLDPSITVAGHELNVTGSIGIVVTPRMDADATAILRDADAAMYRAKEEGRNCYALFDEGLRRRSLERLTVESDLRRALEADEFELYYQPVVDPSSGRPIAGEALIRWNHPTRGLVPPLEFIPVAEASGLIRPIGRWVVEHAFSQLSSWDRDPGAPKLAVMSMNLCAYELEDKGILELAQRVISLHGVDPGRVCFEVTETVAMADNANTRAVLEGFRTLGLRVAIDDFGTGYSSLAYLHTLPVTTVKIDRTFVERLGGPDDSTAVVRAVVEMSHAMGLRVVAEGVSTSELRDAVANLGCDVAQGFYWACPMPAEEFVAWWRDAEARLSDPQHVLAPISR
jgi:diguanylate cyclase (GGDEF)-like protein/PAS domain S-box-containing protein